MVVPNYTYLKLKMSGPNGVVTVKGNFEQAYYCEQDYVAQATTLIVPYAPDGPSRDTGKEATEAAATLDRPSISEVAKVPSGSNGSVGPSI